MIDYIPPDIPPAIVKYADEHSKNPPYAIKRWFMYYTAWNNKEVYLMFWDFDKTRCMGQPIPLLYDCQNVRRLNLEEYKEFRKIMPQYLNVSERPHLCNKDPGFYHQSSK